MSARLALSGLLSGFVFGIGLAVSEMANPDKVLGFLNVLGGWDPSLLFTMGGALVVAAVGYRWVLSRGPLFSKKLHLPTRSDVDSRLLIGASLFGIGWGLSGYCPGPAITGASINPGESVVFLLAMMVGSQVENLINRLTPSPVSAGDDG